VDPYAKPREQKIGAQRPRIAHLPRAIDSRSRKERQVEKQAVTDERRAIKKSARQQLQRQLREELNE